MPANAKGEKGRDARVQPKIGDVYVRPNVGRPIEVTSVDRWHVGVAVGELRMPGWHTRREFRKYVASLDLIHTAEDSEP